MNRSKIKEYVSSAQGLFSIKRLWAPILFTAIFAFPLLWEYLDAVVDGYELISISLFRLIYISYFWMEYFSTKEIRKIDCFIKMNESLAPSLFDDLDEQVFLQKRNELTTYIFVLIVILFSFEGFRFLIDIVSIASPLKQAGLFGLLISGLIFYGLSILSFRRLLLFLKSITLDKKP